jgi:hypothetical protein
VRFTYKKEPYSKWDLFPMFFIALLLCISTFALHYLFANQKLYRSLFCAFPTFERFDFWNSLWTVLLTDFSLKYISMLIKIVVALVPGKMLSKQRKGTLFMHIEQVFTLYRCIPPTIVWILFFTDGNQIPTWYSAVLVILYFLAKALYVWTLAKDSWRSFKETLSQKDIGRVLGSSSHLDNNMCIICHEDMESPLQLKCQHVYCSGCIENWLNHDNTCPLCRVEIVKTSSARRDGSTSFLCQIF